LQNYQISHYGIAGAVETPNPNPNLSFEP